MKKIGLIINPFAGIGGRAGLKGSDGTEIQQKALAEGFRSLAPDRVFTALEWLGSIIAEKPVIVTYPAEMGEDIARKAGFDVEIIGNIDSGHTTAEDTIKAAQTMKDAGVDLIIFAGGDGTARNIYTAVGLGMPVLGIPCGVKMHSACYAINPRRAGDIAKAYLESANPITTEGEVMDIDEEAFRKGDVQARLYGYLTVPEAGVLMQKMKSGTGYNESGQLEELGFVFAQRMRKAPDTLFLVGPGSTTTHVMKSLELPYTLLGVDLVADGKVVAADVNEKQIWDYMQQYEKFVMIITVIGGQGNLFGRGNQQFSPRIIRKVGRKNIWVIASKQKLVDLLPEPFLVDTGDPELDKELCGYIKVTQSKDEDVACKISM